jgi:hypothetical protein
MNSISRWVVLCDNEKTEEKIQNYLNNSKGSLRFETICNEVLIMMDYDDIAYLTDESHRCIKLSKNPENLEELNLSL